MTDNESRQKSEAWKKRWFQPRAADCKLRSDSRDRWADERIQRVLQLWSGWMRRCSWRSTGGKKKKQLVRNSLSKRARQRQTGLPDGEGCYHRDHSGTNLQNQMFTQTVHNSEFNVRWRQQSFSLSRVLSFEWLTCSSSPVLASLWCKKCRIYQNKSPLKSRAWLIY